MGMKASVLCLVGENVLEVFAAIWERLTKEIAQSSPLDLLVKLAAAVIVTAFIYFCQKCVRKLGSWLSATFPSWYECIKKIARVRTAVDEHGPGVWLAIKHNP